MIAQQTTITCQQCGHEQPESVDAISTSCQRCHTYIAVEKQTGGRKAPVRTAPPKISRAVRSRVIICPHCQQTQKVYPQALTITCSQCGVNVNISNHKVTGHSRDSLTTYGDITFVEGCRYLGAEVHAQVIHASGELRTRLRAFSELHFWHRTVITGPVLAERIIVHPGATVYARRMTAGSLEVHGHVSADSVLTSGQLLIQAGGYLSAKTIKASGLEVQRDAGIEGFFETVGSTASGGTPRPS